MNFFEEIKVVVPFHVADLDKTIKCLEERKVYYLSTTPEDVTKPTEREGESSANRSKVSYLEYLFRKPVREIKENSIKGLR